MLHRLLADALVALHLGFVLFVVLGGLPALRWRWWPWVHLPAAAWGFAIEVYGWLCPLTTWENALRRRAGESGYPGGFVEHYLLPVLYPPGLQRGHQWVLAFLVLAVNLAIYAAVWRRRRLRRDSGGR